ncbi:hypothetical protein MUK42_37148 [Musa troglodytarum]|uniref:Uncharacterized protein n=1 Tax=Musa troglodytarum TaxID=320322 RepID=A0A9E7HZK8_9LILI|nr:hypothetical protein MUK42_37148 [Musa troglodytarum]
MPRWQERWRAKERARWAARSATVGRWGPTRIQQRWRPSFRWDLVSRRRWSSNSTRTLVGSAMREAKGLALLAGFPSPLRGGREAHMSEFVSVSVCRPLVFMRTKMTVLSQKWGTG